MLGDLVSVGGTARKIPATGLARKVSGSVYIVYRLEIVKLMNPRIRRREQAAREVR